jgi:hypothetical protein
MHTIEWAAGLFEGEGCIHVDTRRDSSFQLTLRMTDKDVVEQFRDVVGCGNVVELHPPNHKEKGWSKFYSWTISKRSEVQRILSTMLPYFGHRRAHKALNILDNLELATN